MEEFEPKANYRLRVSNDRLSCWLERTDNPIQSCSKLEDVYVQLHELEITYGIDQEAINSAFGELAGSPVIEIAKGIPVKHGQDGRVEVFMDVNPKAQFVPDETANRVDFKSSVKFTMVKQGDLICKLHPPTYGESGRDIYGKEIVPHRGSPDMLRAADGVYMDDNNNFLAARGGRPIIDNKVVKVLDVLEIKGNVSFETGNINYPGPVIIEGDVPDGFEVRSESEVTIAGNVGDALIISGKKITVGGGVLGKEKASLISSGSIQVRFGSYAHFDAREDILITRDLLHCHVNTLGQVKAKGALIGGRINAREGIEANEAGSENSVTTVLRINFNYETERLQGTLHDLLERISKVASACQTYLHTKNIPLDRIQQSKDMLQLFKLSLAKATKLSNQVRVQVEHDRQNQTEARIRLLSGLFTGTRVESPGCSLDIQQNYRACQVLPNIESGKMRVI